MKRRGDWKQTYTGGIFWPLDPRPDEVLIEDIAHALSLTCRFGGHCRVFYSVAQHSVEMAEVLVLGRSIWSHGRTDDDSKRLAFYCLMHDAAEAYVGDLVAPLKRHLPDFQAAEARVWKAIAQRFVLPYELPQEVKRADLVMLATEARDLMKQPPPMDWGLGEIQPREMRIFPTDFAVAEYSFLRLFDELKDVPRAVVQG